MWIFNFIFIFCRELWAQMSPGIHSTLDRSFNIYREAIHSNRICVLPLQLVTTRLTKALPLQAVAAVHQIRLLSINYHIYIYTFWYLIINISWHFRAAASYPLKPNIQNKICEQKKKKKNYFQQMDLKNN